MGFGSLLLAQAPPLGVFFIGIGGLLAGCCALVLIAAIVPCLIRVTLNLITLLPLALFSIAIAEVDTGIEMDTDKGRFAEHLVQNSNTFFKEVPVEEENDNQKPNFEL